MHKRWSFPQISAHSDRYVAYSIGNEPIALFGHSSAPSERYPEIVPGIEKMSLKSIVTGDFHNAILTEDGTIHTLGRSLEGCLGLGDPFKLEVGTPGAFSSADDAERARQGDYVDPRTVREPRQVCFNRPGEGSNPFCLTIAAGGWHCVALATHVLS